MVEPKRPAWRGKTKIAVRFAHAGEETKQIIPEMEAYGRDATK
jgi:hypothetical protein